MERFVEALQDSSSGLTYAALTGQKKKQSVRDAELLFSANLASFMDSQGYTFEAKFIRIILNWCRACDKGLSELQRSRYNYELLNFLLDDLMPWHCEIYDFSTLEVNRYVHMHTCC